MRPNNKYQKKEFFRRNHQIRAAQVRVIDAEAKQVGVMALSEALKMAEEQELDLVEVAPLAQPPVAKLIDYSKFLYQLKKKKQEEKKGAKTSETKQIRFGPFIGEHDLDIKIRKAKEFLADGDKVKFTVRYTGRQMAHQESGRIVLKQVLEKLGEIAKVEREMKMEGRQLNMFVTKNK